MFCTGLRHNLNPSCQIKCQFDFGNANSYISGVMFDVLVGKIFNLGSHSCSIEYFSPNIAPPPPTESTKTYSSISGFFDTIMIFLRDNFSFLGTVAGVIGLQIYWVPCNGQQLDVHRRLRIYMTENILV